MRPLRRYRSFTLTEILIVVAIIAVLIGLLLGALGQVSSARKRAETIGTMQAFLNACNAFRTEHGYPPGVVPEHVLAFHNHTVAHQWSGGFAISSTENALLHLLGGYVREEDVSTEEWDSMGHEWIQFDMLASPRGDYYSFRVDKKRIGEGPIIHGKPYAPYMEPSAAIREIDGSDPANPQWGREHFPDETYYRLPDLVDGWGNPILYVRRARAHGPMVRDAHGDVLGHNQIKPLFYIDGLLPYISMERQMFDDPCQGGDGGSLLSIEENGPRGFSPHRAFMTLSQMIRHPVSEVTVADDPTTAKTPLGDIVLISAGPDGIYMSATDGPASPERPITPGGCSGFSHQEFIDGGPSLIELFDDIRLSG